MAREEQKSINAVEDKINYKKREKTLSYTVVTTGQAEQSGDEGLESVSMYGG